MLENIWETSKFTRCHVSKFLSLYFIFFIFIIFLVNGASAQATQWKSYNIHHPIRLYGAPVSSITANITVYDPDGILLVDAKTMSYNPATLEHNYTLTASQLSKSGSEPYQYTITAAGGGYNNTETFNLYVTPSGQSGLLGFTFFALIVSYGLLFLAVWMDEVHIGMLATFMMFFMGFYLLFNGIDIYKNSFTDAFSVITLGIAAYSTAKIGEQYLGLWD